MIIICILRKSLWAFSFLYEKRCFTNPSDSPAASHLPLHRGGSGGVGPPSHLPRSCAATLTLRRLFIWPLAGRCITTSEGMSVLRNIEKPLVQRGASVEHYLKSPLVGKCAASPGASREAGGGIVLIITAYSPAISAPKLSSCFIQKKDI